jgi:hypothetical protein
MRGLKVSRMKRIYRCYRDTEVSEIVINVKCPHCGDEFCIDSMECGTTKAIECEDCRKEFEVHFDAS